MYDFRQLKGSEMEDMEGEAILPSVEFCNNNIPSRRQYRPTLCQWVYTAALGIIFTAGLIKLVSAIRIRPTDRDCVAQTTVWSPLLEAVEMEEVNFVNDLMHTTQYRGPPTQAIEDAWTRITHLGAVNIPEEKLSLYNKSSDLEWKRTLPEEGGGFLAGIEVFHQLHCLNVIRQYTWLDHYSVLPKGFTSDPVFNRVHVDHCLESIRLAIMCNADLTPQFLEVDSTLKAGVRNDFNTHHKCKKFENLVHWMERNAISGQLANHSEHKE